MSNRPRSARAGVLASVLLIPLSVAACSSSTKADTAAAPTSAASSSAAATDMSAKPFGAACSAVPTSGAGSFHGMSTAQVATAASGRTRC